MKFINRPVVLIPHTLKTRYRWGGLNRVTVQYTKQKGVSQAAESTGVHTVHRHVTQPEISMFKVEIKECLVFLRCFEQWI